jgi:hypothetical protein
MQPNQQQESMAGGLQRNQQQGAVAAFVLPNFSQQGTIADFPVINQQQASAAFPPGDGQMDAVTSNESPVYAVDGGDKSVS